MIVRLIFVSFVLTLPLPIGQSLNSFGNQERPNNQPEQPRAGLTVFNAQVLGKKSWNFIYDLKKEDFLLFEDGQRQEIAHFSFEALPLSIILLLDVSGSMKPVLVKVLDNLFPPSSRLKSEDEIALMVFAEKPKLVQELTKNKQFVADAIRKQREGPLESRTETNIIEALYEATAYLLKAAKNDRRFIIVTITDNVITKDSNHSREEILRDLYQFEGVICGLIVPTEGTFATGLVHLERGVEVYAEETGGVAWVANPSQVAAALVRILDTYRKNYVIGYAPSSLKPDKKFRRIKLKASPDLERREGELVILSKQSLLIKRAMRWPVPNNRAL